MSVKYIKLSVAIHGLDIKDEELAVDFLKGWLKSAVIDALSGNNKELFNFRDEYVSDIEIEFVEKSGKAY
ncbi:MAG TPA: hypothetical protein ENG78_02405 [Acidiferrobacteraceae bacterium]|nr:hypothetical protein [Acidiferrobacteraceae bacterium]HEX19660.1 hypothetical protein [Acidiferrobacteraceae bacterium]